jgi:hypothetical protein
MKKLTKNKLHNYPKGLQHSFPNKIYIGSSDASDYYTIFYSKNYFLEIVNGESSYEPLTSLHTIGKRSKSHYFNEYDELAIKLYNKYMMLI